MITNRFKYIPARNKIGAIIRTTDSIERFSLIKSAVDNLLKIDEISLIFVMIHKPLENSELRMKLKKEYGHEKKRVEFVNVGFGNFHNDLLNYSFNEQTRRGIDYSLSISPEAFAYITRENFDKIVESIKNGVLATGLEIKEYKYLMDEGYFANTFAIYRNFAISFADIWNIQGLTKRNSETVVTSFGMEELYAIKRILEVYGKGSVEIVSPINGEMTYIEDKNSEEWRQREMILKTKMDRLKKLQQALEIDPVEFKKMIIYR